VVVVRVSLGIWPPYQFSMHDTVRIPVRIQDTTRQATLRDLEQLFERRNALARRPEERLKSIRETRPLVPHFTENVGGTGEKPEPASAYQNWIIRPRLPLQVRLDRTFDNAVQSAVKNYFRDSGSGYFYPPFVTGDTHSVGWQAKISNEQYGILKCARVLRFTSEGALHYAEKINRHSSADESASDLFIQSLQFLRFAAEFYNRRDYFAGFTVLQQVDCLSAITFHANFPDANGNYYVTNGITFDGQQKGKAQGTSKIPREVDSLGAEESEHLVLDFMLAHLRELCHASIDYDALKTVIKSISLDRGYFAYF
jgi:hypothetical protein